jgi:hypothetical protein
MTCLQTQSPLHTPLIFSHCITAHHAILPTKCHAILFASPWRLLCFFDNMMMMIERSISTNFAEELAVLLLLIPSLKKAGLPSPLPPLTSSHLPITNHHTSQGSQLPPIVVLITADTTVSDRLGLLLVRVFNNCQRHEKHRGDIFNEGCQV